ncbi:MAG TPA: protein kinase [Kofleriaceae bacterium]|nr:protein kinase [Kofleriaceae bacterium]
MSAQGEAARRLGRYELITRIGQGGMAEVQLALQRGPAGFEKLVVVKLVHDNLATQKTFVDMLLEEARLAALVKHPNVVDIYDLGQADGRYFIAMEYLEGEPLLAVLRAGREGNRLDALSTGRLIADTAEGLDAAHELRSMTGEAVELVHHDISLGNIVVLYTGQVKLVDFGVAKAAQSSPTTSKKVQGKFSYMAPEKLKGEAGDRRSDIFSLGCVMWEALTLKRLFRGGNDAETMKQVLELPIAPPSTINGDVPAEYDEIVMRALDRDPHKRHVSAKELAVEIEELLRKHGYGAKNDRIAKYMQETFKAHIDARKKLVHEVASKGSASAEVVDAAFDEPQLASGSPVTPTPGALATASETTPRPSESDFNPLPRFVPVDTPPPAFVPTDPGAALVPMPPVLPPPIDAGAFDNDLDKATEISAPAFPDDPPPIATADAPVIVDAEPHAELHDDAGDDATITAPPSPIVRLRIVISTPKGRAIAAGIAGLAVLIVLAIALGGSPASDARRVAQVALDAAPVAPVVVPPAPDAAVIATEPTPAPDAADVAAAIPVPPPPPPIRHPPPAPPHVAVHVATAQELFQKAFQDFVRGDTADALATLKTAKTSNPSFAPTWRLLGQVYKKLGDHAQARAAFTRYLALAPTASDAPAIRKEMEP